MEILSRGVIWYILVLASINMHSLEELIPKDKFDIATADKLKGYRFAEIKPIIPQLLEWIQDMNWPVAGPVSNYLESISGNLTPYIVEIFRSNDPTWKYWCLRVFGHSNDIDPALLQEIQKLKDYASKMDIDDGVLEEVNEILQKHSIIKDAINIIKHVKNKITDASDMVWTRYDTAKQLRDELELYIQHLQNGDLSPLEQMKFLFLPTATLQKHSI